MDIFSQAKETVMPTWMKFVNPGDSVQGTYVGKIVGQKDGFGNEQIVYQLLQDNGIVMNVGFGLNKKFLIQEMENVNFGQIVGFKFKGKVAIKDKRTGTTINVNDFGVHQDRNIVNEKWLADNQGNMPEVTQTTAEPTTTSGFGSFDDKDDVPFETTTEDKLAVIAKLAKDKLGVTEEADMKEEVMGVTGVAFIVPNYDQIISKLSALASK